MKLHSPTLNYIAATIALLVVLGTVTGIVLAVNGVFSSTPPTPTLASAFCHADRTAASPLEPSQYPYPVDLHPVSPYQGLGPHPVVLVDLTAGPDSTNDKPDVATWTSRSELLPPEWQTHPGVENRSKIQLVVCQYTDSSEVAATKCAYADPAPVGQASPTKCLCTSTSTPSRSTKPRPGNWSPR